MADHVEHVLVEAQIFRRPAARNDQGVVFFRLDVGEGRVEREIVAALLAISLLALEIVNRCGDGLPGRLARADGVDAMADRGKRLERDHDLIVLAEIADDHQDVLGAHVYPPCVEPQKGIMGARRAPGVLPSYRPQ